MLPDAQIQELLNSFAPEDTLTGRTPPDVANLVEVSAKSTSVTVAVPDDEPFQPDIPKSHPPLPVPDEEMASASVGSDTADEDTFEFEKVAPPGELPWGKISNIKSGYQAPQPLYKVMEDDHEHFLTAEEYRKKFKS